MTVIRKELIFFSTSLPGESCEFAVPFFQNDGVAFFVHGLNISIVNISAVSVDGTEVYNNVLGNAYFSYSEDGNDVNVRISGLYSLFTNVECFRIKLAIQTGTIHTDPQTRISRITYLYSNVLKYIGPGVRDDLATIKYWCNEDAFYMPFSILGSYSKVTVPIILDKPQFKTEDEVYKKLNGDNVVLYSTIAEEYNLQTEYLPYSWHKVIILALSCDHFEIDGVSYYKSSEYSIDWDKATEDDCGNKIARATCKLIKNSNQRNSN